MQTVIVTDSPADLEAENAQLRQQIAELQTALATRAATSTGSTLQPHALPAQRRVTVGTLQAELRKRLDGPSVAAGAITLTSPETFVLLELELTNPGETQVGLDWRDAKLEYPGGEASGELAPIAPDAQRAVGTMPLTLSVAPHASRTVTLLFEVPRAAGERKMRLQLPKPEGAPAELPLS